MLAASIAATPADAMWPMPLVCQYVDGIVWRLYFPFQFNSPAPSYPSVTLPANFETDFASIPKLFWREIHPTHRHIAKMAVVHDKYYRDPSVAVTRLEADNALRAGMEALGAPRWKREIVYYAVRMGGGHSFQPRKVA
jgi:hypothetical protein